MRRSLPLLALLFTAFRPNPSTFVLAGEPLQFDARLRPAFTSTQLRNSFDATRTGFARWAATEEGRRIIRHLDPSEFRVVISEDPHEDGAGRAPQPGIATLVAANDHTKLKVYTMILNPTFGLDRGGRFVALPGSPATPSDLMAIAWAGEMLHIDFYARGISLPHHNRADFQQEWHTVASELGYPGVPHADQVDEDDERMPRRPRVVFWRY
jgi:hypothetical protein